MRRMLMMGLLLVGVIAAGQETRRCTDETARLLADIEQANSDVKQLSGRFVQYKKIMANGKTTKMEGMLEFKSPDYLLMDYSDPDSDMLLIDGDRMEMTRSRKSAEYNLTKNQTMRSLSRILLLSMGGKPMQIAEENDTDVTACREKGVCKVTLHSRKKAAKGYSMIELHYGTGGKVLLSMTMVEYNGNSSVYIMDSPVVSRNY